MKKTLNKDEVMKVWMLNWFRCNLEYITTSWICTPTVTHVALRHVGSLDAHVTCHLFGLLVCILNYFLNYYFLIF